MPDYPHSLVDFRRRFPNEAACANYLAALRWPQGFRRVGRKPRAMRGIVKASRRPPAESGRGGATTGAAASRGFRTSLPPSCEAPPSCDAPHRRDGRA